MKSNALFCSEYYENIRIVDREIQHIVSRLEEYFEHDGKTAFVLTSDHGMTNWGALALFLESENCYWQIEP